MKKTLYPRKIKYKPQKSRDLPGLFITCLKEEKHVKALKKKLEGPVQYIQTLHTEVCVHDTLPHKVFACCL